MPKEDSIITQIAGGVATLTFNRPEALNAIDLETARAFLSTVESIVDNINVRVIVLKGAGRGFIAGGDISAFKHAGEKAPELAHDIIDPMHKALLKLDQARQIVLASLHGPVAGAGMSMALAADLAIAAESTVFNFSYINVGNSPDCGGSWYLSQIVGLRKAMEIALLSEAIDAQKALAWGLVNKVVANDELEVQTTKLAARLASTAPLALASTKVLLRQAGNNSLAAQLDDEKSHFVKNAGSADFQEALAAFYEKRRPVFKGK